MENCYKMYAWICRTIVALMLEMFWKMRQIADYFWQSETEENCQLAPLVSEINPLKKEHKYRRHIRSMSDVQASTPLFTVPLTSMRRISQPILLDCEGRYRRRRLRDRYNVESSDSCSENQEWKTKSSERRWTKYKTSKDTMRYL